MEGDILDEITKIIRLGDKISLTIYFYEHTHLTLEMNVGGDNAFFGGSRCLLGGACDTFLTENIFSFVQVAIGLHQRLLAIHHAGVGLVAQLLDEGGVDFSHKEKSLVVRD